MKKALSLVLVLAMVLGLSVTAFAAASGTGTENDPYLLSTLEVNDVIIATDYIKNDTENMLDYEVRYINSETEQLREMTIQPDPGETKQFTNSYYYPDNTRFLYKGFDATANYEDGAYVFEQITPEEEAPTSSTTEITATKAAPAPLSYEIVIPTDVAEITNFGVYEVGQAKVTNVQNATDNTVISYTAETTAFKCEGKTDIPASYYTDAQGAAAFPTTAVEVYKNKADAASIPTMYVGITEANWNAAENGTYKATVTFNFEAKEAEAPAAVTAADAFTTGAEYNLKFNYFDIKNTSYSFTYKKTVGGFEVVEILQDGEDVVETYGSICPSEVNGTKIIFNLGNHLQFTLDTSTSKYEFTGSIASGTTFTSFSVKPAGATEFTEITLTVADPA